MKMKSILSSKSKKSINSGLKLHFGFLKIVLFQMMLTSDLVT